MPEDQKPKRDKRCDLCGYFHESPFCPDINAKREKKWDEWDLYYQRRLKLQNN